VSGSARNLLLQQVLRPFNDRRVQNPSAPACTGFASTNLVSRSRRQYAPIRAVKELQGSRIRVVEQQSLSRCHWSDITYYHRRTSRTLRSNQTLRTSRALGAGEALRANRPIQTRGPRRASRATRAGRTSGTGRTSRTSRTSRPCGAGRARSSRQAHWPDRSHQSHGSDRSHRTGRAGRSFWPHESHRAHRTRRAGRARRARRARRGRRWECMGLGRLHQAITDRQRQTGAERKTNNRMLGNHGMSPDRVTQLRV
jgi:hypothetical protein